MNIQEIKTILEHNMQEALTEETKQNIVKYVDEKLISTLQDLTVQYISALQTQAEKEKGWVKFRDGIFIPTLIGIGMFLLKSSSKRILNK